MVAPSSHTVYLNLAREAAPWLSRKGAFVKTEAGALPERYVHHGITAGVASFTAKAMRSRYSRTIRHVEFPSTTMAIFAPSNLLIPDTFVGREQNVEPCGLSYI